MNCKYCKKNRPAHARKFYREGVRKIEDLNDRKDELTHEQQLGLKYFQDFEKKIPREEVEKIEVIFLTSHNKNSFLKDCFLKMFIHLERSL